jgi:uncharacterized protein (TIGR03085 family)
VPGSFAQAERGALCDLMLEVGPEAPTLCAGWQVRDLAAHLVVRERRPDAAPGIVLRPLRGHTDRVQRQVRDARPFSALVALVRSGPPAILRPLDDPVNTVEYFVHHEDVRRAAGGEPRPLPERVEAELWRRVRGLSLLMRRKAPAGLELLAPGYGRATVRRGDPSVLVTGPPGELLLFMVGRQASAEVEVSGPPGAVEQVRKASFGL